MRSLRVSLEDGRELAAAELADVHATCGVLKVPSSQELGGGRAGAADRLQMFIRELRGAVFPPATFQLLSPGATGPADRWALLAAQHVSELEPPVRAFACHLLALLVAVAARANVNKMTPANLAISLGPHVLSPPPRGPGAGSPLAEASAQCLVVKRLVELWPSVLQANPALAVDL